MGAISADINSDADAVRHFTRHYSGRVSDWRFLNKHHHAPYALLPIGSRIFAALCEKHWHWHGGCHDVALLVKFSVGLDVVLARLLVHWFSVGFTIQLCLSSTVDPIGMQ